MNGAKTAAAPILTQLRAAIALGRLTTAEVAQFVGVEAGQVRQWLDGRARPCRESRARLRMLLGVAATTAEAPPPARAPKYAGNRYRLAGTGCKHWPRRDVIVEAAGEENAEGMVPVEVAAHFLTLPPRRFVHKSRLLPPQPRDDEQTENLATVADALEDLAAALRKNETVTP